MRIASDRIISLALGGLLSAPAFLGSGADSRPPAGARAAIELLTDRLSSSRKSKPSYPARGQMRLGTVVKASGSRPSISAMGGTGDEF